MVTPTSPRSSRLDDAFQEIVGVGALAAVNVATALAFARIFTGWSFFPPLVVMVLASHGAAALLRRHTVHFLIALPLLCVTVYVLLGHLALGSTLRYGLPLSDSWESLRIQIGDAWNLLGDIVPPVDRRSGFGLVALASLGLSAVLSDSFAYRFAGRVEAFVPATVIFVILAAVGTDRQRVLLAAIWIGAVLAALALMRARDRSLELMTRSNTFGYRPAMTFLRLCLGGVLLAGAIGVGAAVAGPLLPGASQEAWLTTRGQSDSRVLEPLVDVRRRLSNPTDRVLFTVNADRSSYWRLTALPIFDGSTWTIPGSLLDEAGGQLAAVADNVSEGVDVESNLQRFSISNLAGSLLPIAYEPVQLRAASRSLFYELRTASLVVGGDGLKTNDAYELVSATAVPRPEVLAAATVSAPPELDSRQGVYLELPESDQVLELRTIVRTIVSQDSTPYVAALALQSFFRDNFTYSLDVPSDLDGDATLAFLERRTGYCEQFSSTFALFARILGIPARVAVGFTPGEIINVINGRNVYEVRSQHAHAWPELWFDGVGWVLFEPTPGRGAPNAAYTNVPEQQDESIPEPTPDDAVTTTTMPSISEASEPPPADSEQEATTDSTIDGDASNTWLFWILFVAVGGTLWIMAMPRLVQVVATRRRTGTILDSWRRVVALYEFQRGPFDPSLSAHEIATQATSRLWDEDPVIHHLADVVTEFLFAGRDPDRAEIADWTTRIDAYTRHRISRLGFWTRLRLRLDPLAAFRLTGTSRRSRRSGEAAPHR